MVFDIKVIGVERLKQSLTPALFKGPLKKLLNRATVVAESKARSAAPKDTSSMVRNLRSVVRSTSAKVDLPRNLDYYHVMEKGRRPGGRLPPLSAIAAWARRKGISQSLVFPIALSIAKRGIKGRFFMKQGKVAAGKAMPGLLKRMGKEVGLKWQD